MSISEKLQALRKQQGISQEQLAEKLNISRQAVSKWETGETVPDIENIVILSEIFDVSTDYLLKPEQNGGAEVVDAPLERFTGFGDEEEERRIFGFGDINIDLQGGLFPLAVLAYLVMGFVWGLWHPGWIIFPAVFALDNVIDSIRKRRFGISLYGLAGLLYVVLGMTIDGFWRHGWLLFVAAWALSSVFKRPSKKRKNRS